MGQIKKMHNPHDAMLLLRTSADALDTMPEE
jgi:hypothetical protein